MLNWFVKKAVGLDVSDRSIEILELSRWGRRLTVSAAGRALLPAGAVIAGRIKDSKKLAATLAA
ncbi:MAG: pilus assembly protein PilM, partial [Patescibacteria group bacterium]